MRGPQEDLPAVGVQLPLVGFKVFGPSDAELAGGVIGPGEHIGDGLSAGLTREPRGEDRVAVLLPGRDVHGQGGGEHQDHLVAGRLCAPDGLGQHSLLPLLQGEAVDLVGEQHHGFSALSGGLYGFRIILFLPGGRHPGQADLQILLADLIVVGLGNAAADGQGDGIDLARFQVEGHRAGLLHHKLRHHRRRRKALAVVVVLRVHGTEGHHTGIHGPCGNVQAGFRGDLSGGSEEAVADPAARGADLLLLPVDLDKAFQLDRGHGLDLEEILTGLRRLEPGGKGIFRALFSVGEGGSIRAVSIGHGVGHIVDLRVHAVHSIAVAVRALPNYAMGTQGCVREQVFRWNRRSQIVIDRESGHMAYLTFQGVRRAHRQILQSAKGAFVHVSCHRVDRARSQQDSGRLLGKRQYTAFVF